MKDRLDKVKVWKWAAMRSSDMEHIRWLIEEIERLRTANGQLTADLYGMQDGSLLRDCLAELRRIRDSKS